jgi:3-hydroxyisobutyrate dehydrogenase-like beta-hydroxyacid dehydrogenase
MKRIGFVGLGVMGKPMAECLLRSDFEVTAYDVREQAVATLVASGARTARQLEDIAPCDAAIVMVNTDAQARDVIGRLIQCLRAVPRPIFCMSTILPSTIRELAGAASAAGVDLLDAPVSGGPIVAQMGALAIMVGGDRQLFEAARPVFQAMGNTVTHVGPLGSGLTVKLVNNMIAISALPLVVEALCIGLQQGLELATMVEVIKASSGNTWLTDNWERARMFMEFVLQDPAQAEPLMKTGQKDMELAATLCDQAGIEAPMLRHSITALQSQLGGHLIANVRTLLQQAAKEANVHTT